MSVKSHIFQTHTLVITRQCQCHAEDNTTHFDLNHSSSRDHSSMPLPLGADYLSKQYLRKARPKRYMVLKDAIFLVMLTKSRSANLEQARFRIQTFCLIS